jgi:hypothetical protein
VCFFFFSSLGKKFLNLASRVTPDIEARTVPQPSVHAALSVENRARGYPKNHLVRRRLGRDPQIVDVVQVDSVVSTSFPAEAADGTKYSVQIVQEEETDYLIPGGIYYAHGPHRHGKHCPHHRGSKCTCKHKHGHNQHEDDDGYPEDGTGDEDWQGWKKPDDEDNVPHEPPKESQTSPAPANDCNVPGAGKPDIPSGSSNATKAATPDSTATGTAKGGSAPTGSGTPGPDNSSQDSKSPSSTKLPAAQESGTSPKGNSTLTPSAGAPSPGPNPAQDENKAPSPSGSEKPLPGSKGTSAEGTGGAQPTQAQVPPGSSNSSNHTAPAQAAPSPSGGQGASGNSKPSASEEPPANQSTTPLKGTSPTGSSPKGSAPGSSAPGGSSTGGESTLTPGGEPNGSSPLPSDDTDI